MGHPALIEVLHMSIVQFWTWHRPLKVGAISIETQEDPVLMSSAREQIVRQGNMSKKLKSNIHY